MAIPLIVAVGVRVGWLAATRIAARYAAKSTAQAAVRAATSTAGRQALNTASGVSAAIQTAEMAQKLIEEAENETGAQDITCPTGQCNEQAKQEEDKKKEEQEKRLKELEEEAGVEQKTKGKTRYGEKSGGMDQAKKDFDSLKPDNPVTQEIPGKGKITTGKLRDGRDINVRDFSSDGRPTIEIRDNDGNSRGIEIRYDK